MGTVDIRLLVRTASIVALAAGLGVLAAGCAEQLPLAVSGLLAASAGALMIHNDRLRMRIRERTVQLEQSNQQMRAEIGVRKAAESALEASEKRLHDILSTLPMPVIVKDAQSRIQLMNRAVEEKWGVLFDQVTGTTGGEWMTPSYLQAMLEDDRAVFAARDVVVKESQIWNSANGRPIAFESYKKPVYGASGEPHSLICVYVDITQRKHAEDALQRSFLQLRRLTAELEMLKEEDRRRIAQGIHDDLGQNLLALKIDVQMLHARASERHPRLKRRVGHVLDTIDATIRSVRTIMNDLHPSTLELGRPVALEWLVDQFEWRRRARMRRGGRAKPARDP
jgi:two-component system sensor histidine kinase UhpB